MSVIPKIKKFSRSKVDINQTEIIEKVEKVEKVKKVKLPKKEELLYESEIEPEIEPEYYNYDADNEDVNFLSDLNNENYKEEVIETKQNNTLTTSEMIINQLTSGKKPPKQKKVKEIKSNFEDDDSLFDEIGTVCLGRDKRELIAKINQYKNLFPDELKKFKVKKGANVEELKVFLSEMESIVDCSNVENFLNDSILQCIKLIEGASSYSTKYNIQGCAYLLKSNKQFHSLTKQLYIKYKVFSAIPCEFQLLMLVATSAYICKAKNNNRGNLEAYLNQPINLNNE